MSTLATTKERKRMDPYKFDESGRLIVWLARSSWYGGKATNKCAFASRAEAIRWAKDQAAPYIDWTTWKPSLSKLKYPNDSERDNVQLTPTFRASWTNADGGSVSVEEMIVSERYDWGR